MPNWVVNKVTVLEGGEEFLRRVADALSKKEMLFEEFIPVPETYKVYDTTNHPDGKGLVVGKKYTSWPGSAFKGAGEIITQQLIDEYKAATKEQEEKYGAVGWYHFGCKYWGTKWDVSDFSVVRDEDTGTIEFSTAWSMPEGFYARISEMYPEMKFLVEYADEDMGNNCGAVLYHNTTTRDIDASTMYALTLHGCMPQDIWEFYSDAFEEEEEN